jgi:hypothetical protein
MQQFQIIIKSSLQKSIQTFLDNLLICSSGIQWQIFAPSSSYPDFSCINGPLAQYH